MSPFRNRRPADDDPTQILQTWRDQQRDERLADTREFPEFLETTPASTRPAGRRRRVPLLLATGVGALVVVGAVALASAVTGPDRPSAGSGTATTAPTTTAPSDTPTATAGGTGDEPSDAPTGTTGNTPAGPDGRGSGGQGAGDDSTDGPPAPPDGGPAGPGADSGPGADGGPAGPGADAGPPAPPGR